MAPFVSPATRLDAFETNVTVVPSAPKDRPLLLLKELVWVSSVPVLTRMTIPVARSLTNTPFSLEV